MVADDRRPTFITATVANLMADPEGSANGDRDPGFSLLAGALNMAGGASLNRDNSETVAACPKAASPQQAYSKCRVS
jgi:hypothetical protein